MVSETRLEVQQTQKLSQSLQRSIRLLSMDQEGLSEEIRKAVQENPALEYVQPQSAIQDYAVTVKSHYYGKKGGNGDFDQAELAEAEKTQMDDLEQQLRLSGLDSVTLKAALRLLHLLTPRGYFLQDMDEFALESGVSIDTAHRALEAVQGLEPVGVGARSVEECLELQLRAKSDTDPLCYELIRAHLLEIARGNMKQIAKETGATMAHVQQCVDEIRSLTPTPCSLETGTVQYIVPEFSVEVDSVGQITIQFHNDYYPTVRQSENFSALAQTLEGDEYAFAKKMRDEASQMIHAIELRQTTMEKLAKMIVREQEAFFLGQYSLKPLRIDEAAKEIGVHETTVYRAVQNKYLYCAKGMFPLSYFFPKEVSGGSSTERVKEMIREICRENDKISDRAIAEALEKRGVSLSRRTVAKYRAQMDIHSSFHR